VAAGSKDGAQRAEIDGLSVGGDAGAVFRFIFCDHDEREGNVCYAFGFSVVELVGDGVEEEEIVKGAADLAYAVAAIA